jgi:hypothetical protein
VVHSKQRASAQFSSNISKLISNGPTPNQALLFQEFACVPDQQVAKSRQNSKEFGLETALILDRRFDL